MKLQSRLVIGFLIATCLTGAVATLMGITMINMTTLDEVQRKVQQDITQPSLSTVTIWNDWSTNSSS
jgi:hypothetical protein